MTRADGNARTFGQDLMRGEHVVGDPTAETVASSGTSIFDPVICELAYRWFSPPGGVILDPFAGGSVRGIVASKLGRRYVGHELRGEQVLANREQGSTICVDDPLPPAWVHGDSRTIDKTCGDVQADMIFSCPPYADLEVYSDDPLDLSTMDYADFLVAYREIIAKTCALLRNDRFACFIVGDVRDRRGAYLNFVGDTVEAFRAAGLAYYNEAILVTAVGSLPIRVGKQFSTSRKLGKTHQNVLVFVKGDGRRAAEACGPVDVSAALSLAAADAGDAGAADPEGEIGPTPDGARRVKISAASARWLFAGCTPDYIKTTCRASCCQSSTSPTGTIITVHPREVAAIARRGGVVVDGLLQPRPGERRCPFKTAAHLCGLHETPDKPFGCIASPFTLNANGTLIVRNRYKLLKCYNDGARIPAYRAFRASLDLIFGDAEAARICAHLDAGGGDLVATMTAEAYETLRTNDDIKKASTHSAA